MTRQEQFREILRKYGVTKCYVSGDVSTETNFNFEQDGVGGRILVDIKNEALFGDIYHLFEVQDESLLENWCLLVWSNDFSSIRPNFQV